MHFFGEMSERKEGRGKGKGKKKDRGSGKKPAPAPAAGDQSPGECAARGLRDPPPLPPVPTLLPRPPARALRSERLALLPGDRGAERFSSSVAPPLTCAPSPTRAPAPRVQGKGGSLGSRSPRVRDKQRSQVRPFTSVSAEPSPGAGPGVQEPRLMRVCLGPGGLCTGPVCPLAREAGTGLPSVCLAQKNQVVEREAAGAVAHRCFGQRGGRCRVPVCRTSLLIQSWGIGTPIG